MNDAMAKTVAGSKMAQEGSESRKALWQARKVQIVAEIKLSMLRAQYLRNLQDRAHMLAAI